MRDGFDASAIQDALLFNDTAAATYVPLDAALHGRIVQGKIRI
jgi:hypothetical protein